MAHPKTVPVTHVKTVPVTKPRANKAVKLVVDQSVMKTVKNPPMPTAGTVALIGARELERQIFQREGVRVILLCPNSKKFKPYPYKKCTDYRRTVAYFRDERLIPCLGPKVEFIIVKGDFEDVTNNGKWKMSNIRPEQ